MRTARLVTVTIATLSSGARGADLVANASFEDSIAPWGLPAPLYAIDTSTAHSGTASLRYHGEPGGPLEMARGGRWEGQDCVFRFPATPASVRDRTSGRAVALDGARVRLRVPALDARMLVASGFEAR